MLKLTFIILLFFQFHFPLFSFAQDKPGTGLLVVYVKDVDLKPLSGVTVDLQDNKGRAWKVETGNRWFIMF